MDIYKALAEAMIITCGIPVLIYAGLIIADVVKYKVKRRRFERRFCKGE